MCQYVTVDRADSIVFIPLTTFFRLFMYFSRCFYPSMSLLFMSPGVCYLFLLPKKRKKTKTSDGQARKVVIETEIT